MGHQNTETSIKQQLHISGGGVDVALTLLQPTISQSPCRIGNVTNNIMVIMLTERPVNKEQLMCINISFSFAAYKMYGKYLHAFAVSMLTTVDAEFCYGFVCSGRIALVQHQYFRRGSNHFQLFVSLVWCWRRVAWPFKYRNKMTVTDGLRQQKE